MDSERLRTVLGPRKDRYLAKFARTEHVRGWVPGWNTAAFLHSTAWLWYRRMYGWSLLNLFAPVLLLFVLVFVVQWFVPESSMNAITAVTGALYGLFMFVAVPVYADTFYYRFLKRRHWRGKPPSPWTLAGAILLIVVPLAIAYAAAEAHRESQKHARPGPAQAAPATPAKQGAPGSGGP
jgi:polyferredoxin